MTLLHDLILVKPTKENQLKNGLIIPETAQKKNKGEIILIGKKVKKLSVGQQIMYYDNCGTPLNYHGEPMLLLSESQHIIGVLETNEQ